MAEKEKIRRRGQISLFIIVGVLIVAIGGLFYTMRGEIADKYMNKPPSEINEIVTYTESCLSQLAEEGVFIESMQGGYIDIPYDISVDRRAHIDLGMDIPYWYYKYSTRKPTISEMEAQLGKYIDDNLLSCLNLYIPFANRYDIKFEDFPKSEVDITQKSIIVKTTFPLDILRLGSTERINWGLFRINLKNSLGERYALASELMDYENSEAFLEFYTDEMIAASDYLPYEGMEFSCSPKFWTQGDMKEYTQQMIMHNLNYLRFEKTDYSKSGIPYYDKLYKVDFTNNDYSKYSVKALYNPLWGMDFEAVPSENGIVEPYEFEITKYLRSCIKVYHEKYNIVYPVLFQIIETESPEHVFYFATPVMLRQSQANRHNEVSPWYTEEDPLASKVYCAPTENVYIYSIDENGFMTAESSVFDKRQNELRVYAIDALYGFPDGVLFGVNISYQCVKAKCNMGTTGFHETFDGLVMYDAFPKLVTGFPECLNGYIIAEKPGYHRVVKQQTVSQEENGAQVTLDMYQLREFDYDIRVIQEHNGVLTERGLEDGEVAFLTIKNKEMDFEKEIIYPNENDHGYYSNLTMLVGDFDYELEIIITKDDLMTGGAHMNWTVPLSSVMYNNYVIFYAYNKDPISEAATPEEELYLLYKESIDSSANYPPRFG